VLECIAGSTEDGDEIAKKIKRLEKPYIRTAARATVNHIKKFLAIKLKLDSPDDVDVLCKGKVMEKESTLGFIKETQWGHNDTQLELQYRPARCLIELARAIPTEDGVVDGDEREAAVTMLVAGLLGCAADPTGQAAQISGLAADAERKVFDMADSPTEYRAAVSGKIAKLAEAQARLAELKLHRTSQTAKTTSSNPCPASRGPLKHLAPLETSLDGCDDGVVVAQRIVALEAAGDIEAATELWSNTFRDDCIESQTTECGRPGTLGTAKTLNSQLHVRGTCKSAIESTTDWGAATEMETATSATSIGQEPRPQFVEIRMTIGELLRQQHANGFVYINPSEANATTSECAADSVLLRVATTPLGPQVPACNQRESSFNEGAVPTWQEGLQAGAAGPFRQLFGHRQRRRTHRRAQRPATERVAEHLPCARTSKSEFRSVGAQTSAPEKTAEANLDALVTGRC